MLCHSRHLSTLCHHLLLLHSMCPSSCCHRRSNRHLEHRMNLLHGCPHLQWFLLLHQRFSALQSHMYQVLSFHTSKRRYMMYLLHPTVPDMKCYVPGQYLGLRDSTLQTNNLDDMEYHDSQWIHSGHK